jgi:hypothetical protein
MKMMKTTDSDPVQDYILEDQDHMRIAADVFDAWSEVRNRLVSAFLDRLERALKQKRDLEGWEFGRYQHPFMDSYASLEFWRVEWKREYYVSLALTEHGQEVIFGLGRDWDQKHIAGRPRSPELLTAVKKHYSSASDRRWWEARVAMPRPTDDWTKWEVLWRMRDENDEFLNEVAAHLLDVAKISEKIVDRLARMPQRAK